MRTSATGPVYASSAVDAPVIRSITVVVVLSCDHCAVGSGASGSVHAVCTYHCMGLIADRKTADQYHNRKRKASHRKLRLLPSRISKLLPSTVPNNVTVIKTRDERGGRLILVGTNPVSFATFILAATLG
jgi:hypothetical protein